MRFKLNKKAGIAVLVGIAVIVLGALLMQVAQKYEFSHSGTEVPSDSQEEDTGDVYYQGQWYTKRTDLDTVLLMGVDKYEADTQNTTYENDQQADFLFLVVFDPQSQTYTPIHLNRDTMTDIKILGVSGTGAGSFEGQLALAHTFGSGKEDSCINQVDAVSNLLYGVKIDHYIALTMDAVATLNDLAGGVTLTVRDDFSAVDDTLKKGETVTLMGKHALTYVRNRMDVADGTNLSRMERQRQYLIALQEQLTKCEKADPDFAQRAALSIADYMVSDYSANQLQDFSEKMSSYKAKDVQTLPGEAVMGKEYVEYYVDDAAVQDIVMQIFYQPVSDTAQVDK